MWNRRSVNRWLVHKFDYLLSLFPRLRQATRCSSQTPWRSFHLLKYAIPLGSQYGSKFPKGQLSLNYLAFTILIPVCISVNLNCAKFYKAPDTIIGAKVLPGGHEVFKCGASKRPPAFDWLITRSLKRSLATSQCLMRKSTLHFQSNAEAAWGLRLFTWMNV